ncbi:hypothetical protein CYMTET_14648 [Cymbomonas tetramitiformis]|uniref:Uncharacterized protein n=1 Tax=Cymbomonas tetramitiformis TaxID=36881 RepID=A0AAE0LA59_9CHLO|nr:hypothetical protein CYMTET_14648 [Cymbomonas tetramitiformis]
MLCTSHGADSAIHRTLCLLTIIAGDPWESAIQSPLTTTDKALLRMTCRELREKYRRCVQIRVSETLSASPSLHLFTKASLPGAKFSDGTCHFIAGEGRVDMLEYARREEAWDVRTTRAAASNGHLDCLRYAHENGCPWDVSVCSGAAFGGHLECLRYAHDHGCPWNVATCVAAAKPLEEVTWHVFDTLTNTDASGTRARARKPLEGDTWNVCNTPMSAAASGTRRRSEEPLVVDIWNVFNTLTNTAANGAFTRAVLLLQMGTLVVCGTPTKTDAKFVF